PIYKREMALDYQPIFVLASGMLLQERKLGVITNNLANLDTPSFKRDLLLASAWYTDTGEKRPTRNPEDPSNNFVYPVVGSVFTDLSQGPLRRTENTLDLAIEGRGFFGVRTPEGVRYTRKGTFSLDREGFLVTEEGYRVLDRDGNEIALEGGRVVVDQEGNIYVDGELVATIGVWDLEDPQKVGFDLFVGNPAPAENFRVRQGFIEMSNVNGVLEMVRIIETSRAHEVYSRLIQALDEVQERVNSGMR
ncbi:MAG: flagellar hook-basal body protein, partial [Aquificota bacterium]|nr:flagellar hook-basal body protein [Aquificota bacterium]